MFTDVSKQLLGVVVAEQSVGQEVSMKVHTEVVLPMVVPPEGLIVQTVPSSPIREGYVVLRMEATGVSFAEQQMRRGKYYDQPPFPVRPGRDRY
jgi:hypothetical protein